MTRNNSRLEITVYKNPSDNDIFELKSFSPNYWKQATLKAIISRAYLMYSNTEYLQRELDDIFYIFGKYSDFPKY